MGMLLYMYEAAATLTVGTDAARNERKRVTSDDRVLTGVAVVGGNAINQAAVDIYIQDFYVGRFRNTKSGAVGVAENEDVVHVGPHMVPAASQLSAIIQTAPTVSPLTIILS